MGTRTRQPPAIGMLVVLALATGCGPPPPPADTCTGDVVIHTEVEWATFVQRRCTSLFGSLTIGPSDIVSPLSDLELTTVSGALRIDSNPTMPGLELPALTVTGDVIVSNNRGLTGLDFPAFTTLNGTAKPSVSPHYAPELGGLSVSGNLAMTILRFPVLTSVKGNVSVLNNDVMTTLDLSALTTASGTFEVNDNDQLTALELTSLTAVPRNLSVRANIALTTLSMPVLDHVTGSAAGTNDRIFGFFSLSIANNRRTATCRRFWPPRCVTSTNATASCAKAKFSTQRSNCTLISTAGASCGNHSKPIRMSSAVTGK